MKKKQKIFSEPLHVTISVLFSILILALGLVMSMFSHRRTTDIVMDATRKLFHEFSLEIAGNFRGTYSPVIQALSLLSYTETLAGGCRSEQLKFVDIFADVLRHSPSLSGLQIGYDNGDYLIVHPVRSEHEKTLFNASEDAAYVVDNIIAGPDDRRMMYRYYLNRKLQVLEKKSPVATEYDPRTRPWYIEAMETSTVVSTAPYFFYFYRRMGVTIARQVPGGNGVVAADVTLAEINNTISRTGFAPHEQKAVIDANGRVLVSQGSRDRAKPTRETRVRTLAELDSPVLRYVGENLQLGAGEIQFRFQGRDWLGMIADLDIGHNIAPRLLLVAPADEILTESWLISRDTFLLTLLLLAIAIPVTWLISRQISVSIRRLAGEARRVSRFDFDSPVAITSRITEVSELAASMRTVNATMGRFLELVAAIAGEQDFAATLTRITRETMHISRADAVVTYLVNEAQTELVADVVMTKDGTGPEPVDMVPVPLGVWFEGQGEEMVELTRANAAHYGLAPALFGRDSLSVVPIALVDRQGEEIGLLALLYRDFTAMGELDDRLSFVRAISGFAAVSLETRHLIQQQKQLLDSLIELLAGAIDTKSAYTGGHCQRVPVIAEMLARSACESDQPPFADFDLDREQWEELHLAAWLHDCGKVTTPEYVVDKATKLETIYNRIHEIRTRFEVLKRDAEIRFWQELAQGGEREKLEAELQQALAELDDDFAFVARCNLGSEFMEPEDRQRLARIATRTWMRTLDNRLGISWQEAERLGEPEPLPVEERLLADRPEHCIPRPEGEQVDPDNPWGFRLEVPRYLYNLGELYNLSIERGTLTAEERFKINDHIVQTIKMLSQLPFPRHLQRVTEIAGSHHETMIGTGYPRRLRAEDMSLTARMMAIADIFEALTASDRPYKKPKTLAEAVRILFFMKKDRHIDGQLFDLFLTSGVYRRYAEKYLKPEQIDEVDIKEFLG